MLDPRRIFTKQQRRQILVSADYKCELCGCILCEEWHAHHREPWINGGLTEIHNGMAVCISCHIRIHKDDIYSKKMAD